MHKYPIVTIYIHNCCLNMTRRKHTNCKASLSSALDDTAAASAASSPTPECHPQTKKQKFEEQYKTDETSDLDVLSM